MTSRMKLMMILGGSASALALAAPAAAQTNEQPALEDIVVTAQKRAENLQEVPIAISAIGAEKIAQLGVQDARDLSGLAPNVTIMQGTTSNSAAVISIRGIPTPASETFGLDTANALYVDGVYIGRSGASGLDVMDIERVEVLRGPQGTLFGRNTTGGAIAFYSRAPSREFRLQAEAGLANYGAWNGKIIVDPGEFAGISTSFSYTHRQRDGVIDNLLESKDSNDPGARQSDAFRGAVKADIGTTGRFQYIFDWSKVRGRVMAFQLTDVANGSVRPPIVIDGQPVIVTQQAPVAQYLASATFLEPDCAALGAPTRAYRKQICLNADGDAIDKTWGHNIQIENDFDAFRIKSTTGYRFWNSSSRSDLDGLGTIQGPAFTSASLLNGMPASLLQFVLPPASVPFVAGAAIPTTTEDLFATSNHRKHKQFSQEIEIAGDTDLFDWVVGGFYFWEKGSENNPQNSGFGLDTNQIFLANFGALGSSLVAANPARYRLVETHAVLRYTATNESTAVYAQTTFYPVGRDGPLSLTAGGRYTWDKKNIVRTQNGAAPLATPEYGDASFSKFTWNLMARYQINDMVNAYGRIATGYRSGGFNAQDQVIRGTTQLPFFNEESVMSYEVGLKTELFDRRLRFNVAGYHNVYDDLAVNIPLTDAPAGTFASRIGNAGKVTYTGIEAEAQAILTSNFSLDGSIGYVDIKYKEFLAGQSTTPGNPPVNIAPVVTPGYTAPLTANFAANAQFPLGWGDTRLVARVAYTYEDGKYSFTSLIASPYNDALKGDNRNLLDASISIDRIAFGGGEAQVKIWGKNLTNAHDFVRGVDFGQLGYGGGFFADPRTYGVTFGVKF